MEGCDWAQDYTQSIWIVNRSTTRLIFRADLPIYANRVILARGKRRGR